MKKEFYKYILLAIVLFSLGSCSKWLDVKPEDKFVEDQLYSSPQGFADALNGFYINNGSASLYGGTLTMTTIDVLAQLYNVGSTHKEYTMSVYNYEEKTSKSKIDEIWTNLYANIANVNKFLESLNTYGQVLDAKTLDQYKGEAIGLRAFYYFDLMRMFSKPYTTADSLTVVLPYYDKVGYDISEFKPANFVMQKVLSDLSNAESLLLNSDPVLTQARVSKPSLSYGRDGRTYRMNYYAVKALQARVNLWKGDKTTALTIAKSLIVQQDKFPWTTLADLNVPAVSNKVFATEMIFGAESPRMQDQFLNVFSPTLFDDKILAPNSTGTFINNTVFENLPNDYRSQFIWKVAGKPYPTFFKYQVGGNISYNFNNTVPLIKMSEMYLIAAESDPDNAAGIGYLNTLRTKRNIAALPLTLSATELNTNIMKEYRREFYGEGQLFYYYKRTKAASLIAGATNTSMNINASSYVFPVPLSETTPR
ncbi:RagB/SusD family nutrient uptake outer membrane protein [Pedobacter caeni]|uniref:SusD family protein n=1 Tax=Pedobacter caeni TaxID=288992 RepID=A0A1M5DKD7_9SPHI|nr:RagB/SusD family nutrient uptake outer membrane protein [Pedobacter caeni]SHF67488.1 SusD family protein [Pedobacter caeni]